MTDIDEATLGRLLAGARHRPLLFASVGSDHHRFDRLVGWIDHWAASRDVECVVQYGTSSPPEHATGIAYLDRGLLQEGLRTADVVVVQGGPMSIIESRRNGTRPIVVPRLSHLKEVVDDHQVVFCRRLAEQDRLDLAEDEPTLCRLLDEALAHPSDRVIKPDDDEGARTARAVERIKRAADTAVALRRGDDTPRVLLLGGAGRSGSTLLERVLSETPSVAGVGETVHLWERGVRDDELCGCRQPFGSCPFWLEVGRVAYGGWSSLDADEVVALKASVVRWRHSLRLRYGTLAPGWRLQRDRLARLVGLLHRSAAEISGAQVLVDSSKHPAYALLLRRAAVDLRCVLVVRDPRAVAFAWQKSVSRPEVVTGGVEMPRYRPAYTALTWQLNVALYRALQGWGVPLLIVRYEDFMADPAGTTREVLRFAGLPAGDAEDIFRGDLIELGPSHTVAGNPMRFRTGETQLSLDEAWVSRMRRRDRLVVSALTAAGRRRFGYR